MARKKKVAKAKKLTRKKTIRKKSSPRKSGQGNSGHSITAPSLAKCASSSSKSTSQHQLADINFSDIFKAIRDSLKPESTTVEIEKRDDLLQKYLWSTLKDSTVYKQYNVILLYDEYTMIKSDIDKIYTAVTTFEEKKPILLVLHSLGGDIGSAYLIGKLCSEYADNKFAVVVPRRAKSAATLVCCAADELHMGSLSELGPIDPQMEIDPQSKRTMPALGLKSSIEHIAETVKNYPSTAEMFAKYLHYSLKPIDLGYYERVAESAVQYAERLLKDHKGNPLPAPEQIASRLVYTYKDHGFVIDKGEASDIFGKSMVKTNTPEYKLGNTIYEKLSTIYGIADYMRHIFYWIGTCESKPTFQKRRR